MFRLLAPCFFSLFAAMCFAADHPAELPQPHYHPQPDDPAWLGRAAAFHGHLGPMLTFGARMGMAGLREVGAKGYFDVEIVCEGPMARPPASCFLDGLQVSTGATLGKRNLRWVGGEAIVVRVTNTTTGKTATLTPRKEFLALLPRPAPDAAKSPAGSPPSQAHDHSLDDLARKIALMPEKDILTIDGGDAPPK